MRMGPCTKKKIEKNVIQFLYLSLIFTEGFCPQNSNFSLAMNVQPDMGLAFAAFSDTAVI
jgi:hypothetical protein